MGSQASTPVMTAPHAAPGRQRPPLLVVGIFIFLGSELMFFGSLFATYFTMRSDAKVWPPPDIELAPLWRPALFTAVLLASSFTMQAADRAIKRGNPAAMKRWIWLTFAMGIVFLSGQFWDYFTSNFGIETNAYGSAFYTLTGFHAMHVVAGLIVMLVVLGRTATRAYDEHDHAAVEAATYYWHFVDVVWLGLFSVLFLLK
jgi:cytochrome c oxidase subunit III